MGWPLALILGLTLSASADAGPGAIRGVVVNATQSGTPCPQAEVVLRLQVDGQFVPVAETLTDAQGRFQFANLAVGERYLYLPGANRADVHYPGPRTRLSAVQPEATVRLEVCDTVTHPSPLVLKSQDILIEPQPGALRVTESLVIENPTSATYVGQADNADAEPVTLQLAIPPEFERTTFHKEFFGRNFAIRGDKVVTGIPWTPGRRELTFTYTLRNEDRQRVWQRPLDLPCARLRVRVRHDQPDEVSCSLGHASAEATGEVLYESADRTLPAGHVVRVELGRLPRAWTSYGRWIAGAVLLGLIGGVAAVVLPAASPRGSGRGKSPGDGAAAFSPVPSVGPAGGPPPTPPCGVRRLTRRRAAGRESSSSCGRQGARQVPPDARPRCRNWLFIGSNSCFSQFPVSRPADTVSPVPAWRRLGWS